MFHTTINYITLHQEPLLALVGGAAGLSAFAELILHKLKVKFTINSKAFSFALVQLLAIIASLASWVLAHENLELVYPWLATIAAFVHRYLVSPVYTTKILPYLEQRAETKAKFLEWVESQKPAAEAPTSTTPEIV